MAIENDVRAASEKFYSALNRMLNRDAGPLGDIWSHSTTVTTMHPIGGREVGWDQVRGSWEQVAQLATPGQVRLSDQFIQVAGDTAYELGVEHGQFTLVGLPVTADLRVTNIYRRESGGWKIVHHHTDAVQSMIDALSRPATSLSIVILPRGERAENLEHEFFIPSTSVLYGSTRVQPS